MGGREGGSGCNSVGQGGVDGAWRMGGGASDSSGSNREKDLGSKSPDERVSESATILANKIWAVVEDWLQRERQDPSSPKSWTLRSSDHLFVCRQKISRS